MTDTAGPGAGGAVSEGPAVELDRQTPHREPTAAIVVGFDRSPASLAALGKAAELGSRLAAELWIVHAVDLDDYPVDPDVSDWEQQAAETLEEDRQRVSAALAGYPCGWSYTAIRAEPAEALTRVAREVDATMIVLGVRGNGWRHVLERLVSPSVSHRVISHCPVPVLVVSYHDPGRDG